MASGSGEIGWLFIERNGWCRDQSTNTVSLEWCRFYFALGHVTAVLQAPRQNQIKCLRGRLGRKQFVWEWLELDDEAKREHTKLWFRLKRSSAVSWIWIASQPCTISRLLLSAEGRVFSLQQVCRSVKIRSFSAAQSFGIICPVFIFCLQLKRVQT
jgi:hypothetical protein